MKLLTWPEVIGRRLRRHYLLEPAPAERMVDVVRAVCGIQAQVPAAAELCISARVAGVTRQDVRNALWEKHSLVRTNGPRETKHILPADELPLWIAALKAGLAFRPEQVRRPGLSIAEIEAMLVVLREAPEGLVLTREELVEKMIRHPGSHQQPRTSLWDEALDRAFYEGLLVHGPDEGGKATYARADRWIESWEQLNPGESIAEVCRRYISTYGPVTHQDFARWMWIKPEASFSIFDSIRPELEEVKIERYRGWILAADAGAEAGWEPVEGSLRLVPQYECYLLGSYPRRHIVPDAFKGLMSTLNRANYDGAVGLSVLLIDGVVSGMWRRKPKGKRLDIHVSPIVTLTPSQHEQLEGEIERISTFLGTDARLTVGPPERYP